MTQINTKRLVDNISRTNVYTPIVDAIVNAIDAIEEAKGKGGKIEVVLYRDIQKSASDEIAPVVSIGIRDNGVGFNQDNRDAFETIYTDRKIKKGGKGFGRFVFLKYFKTVEVESVFKEKNKFQERTFRFVKDSEIIQNEKVIASQERKTHSTILLDSLRKEHVGKFDKKLETIARKILENILVYFALDDFQCPEIVVRESDESDKITLNDYLKNEDEITQISSGSFEIENNDKKVKEEFKCKIFKVFYSESRSSINLVADKRQVTEEALHEYVPEFKDDFYDDITSEGGEKKSKNYTIKAYVLGDYLNENVSLDRGTFEFQSDKDLFAPFSQKDIESKAAEVVKSIFQNEVKTRQDKKEKEIRAYVDERAPWHRPYLSDLDMASMPYKASEEELETALQRAKFRREQLTRGQVQKILDDKDGKLGEKVEGIIEELTELGKSELAHYVVLRKAIIDLFEKSLKITEDKGYEKEEAIHDLIFPTGHTSEDLSYEKHNLWLIDERLSFHEYLSSDKILGRGSKKRPDILIFNNRVSFRGGDELSSPITVFELKRPQRKEYEENDDPIKQIGKYIEKIRSGKVDTPEGRTVQANERTPAYGYLVCDLTPKIKEFCKDNSLTESPDGSGYFGYHNGYQMYIEVISFNKLVKDASLRNKIFFKMLKIE